jgi:MFS family permease
VTEAPALTDGLWSGGRRALTIGLILTITLVAFEALAISTIMPIVAKDLQGIELYGWVFSAFLLTSLIGIAASGGLIDRVGLVKPFVAALLLFGVGLTIGGLAPSMGVVVLARSIQGLGAGAIPPISYVAIGRSMPDRLRPQMFALLATAWVLPGVVGPVIAATVATQLHWRLVFLGLLPIIAVAAIMTLVPLRRVPMPDATESSAEHAAGERSMRRLPRAIAMAFGAALLLAGLSAPTLLIAVPVAIVGLVITTVAFRSLAPAGTLTLKRGLPAAILLRGAMTFAFFAVDTYVPLALQGWRGLSAEATSVAVTAATLSWTGGAWVQARRIHRFGPAWFVRLGFFVVTVGLLGTMTLLLPDVPIAVGVVALAIACVGMGFGYSALSLIVLREAPPGEEGVPTSALQLSDVLGTTLGTGIGGALVAAAARADAPVWVGLAGSFAFGIAMGALGLLGSGRLFTARTGPAFEDESIPEGDRDSSAEPASEAA